MMIDGKTRTLGLLGDPVEHTMSPLIHNTLSETLGLNNVYVPFHTKAEDLGEAVKGAYALNILGLNVTVPHKNEVMKYLSELDEGAQAIGALIPWCGQKMDIKAIIRICWGFFVR